MADERQENIREYVDRQVFEAIGFSTPCLVCGDDVPITYDEFLCNGNTSKICDRCKEAVLIVRQNIEDSAAHKPIYDGMVLL